MTKRLNRALALAAIGLCCIGNSRTAFAGTPEVELLQQQVSQLMKQNEELTRRISTMEKGMQSQSSDQSQTATGTHEGNSKQLIEEEVARQLKDKGGQKINEYVTLSGLIEGDMIFAEDFEGTSSSHFDLSTAELIFDIQVTDWATGHLVIDYDGGDDEDLYVDEANISLGNTEQFPLFLTAGKIYAPFGDFSTSMIQDPFTLVIGETNVPGVIGGFEMNGITATLFGYSGMNETNSDSSIQGYGAALAYSYKKNDTAFNAGISWISNIADSGGISDAFDEFGIDTISSLIDGFSVHLGGAFGPVSLITEYTTALDSFAPEELLFIGYGAQPSAWNTELAWTTKLLTKETVVAFGYQQTEESVSLGLPQQRFSIASSMFIFTGTTLTLEYYLDQDYSFIDGGTDEEAYGFTTRLAYEF